MTVRSQMHTSLSLLWSHPVFSRVIRAVGGAREMRFDGEKWVDGFYVQNPNLLTNP